MIITVDVALLLRESGLGSGIVAHVQGQARVSGSGIVAHAQQYSRKLWALARAPGAAAAAVIASESAADAEVCQLWTQLRTMLQHLQQQNESSWALQV
jgi:hypothetical protein